MSEKLYHNDQLEFAEKYSEIKLPLYKEYQFNEVSKLVKQFPVGKCALDYGCGDGVSTLVLKSLGFIVDGVDINEQIINIARQRDPLGQYQCIKSGEIPKLDNFYDLVYSCYVLVYINTKEELFKVCQDIVRVLKKGGIFIAIVDHENKFKYNNWKGIEVDFNENKQFTSGCVHKTKFTSNGLVVYTWYWSDEDYLEALTKAGLSVIHFQKPSVNHYIMEKEMVYGRVYVAKKV